MIRMGHSAISGMVPHNWKEGLATGSGILMAGIVGVLLPATLPGIVAGMVEGVAFGSSSSVILSTAEGKLGKQS